MRIFKVIRWKAPKPNSCPRCGKNDQLVWDKGEWKCVRCDHVC
ncbi:transposase [Shimazuella sp. AN120528]|nr:transposase [Shimazuella soli]MCH5584239.1 transposase [Shimazuella soli]